MNRDTDKTELRNRIASAIEQAHEEALALDAERDDGDDVEA